MNQAHRNIITCNNFTTANKRNINNAILVSAAMYRPIQISQFRVKIYKFLFDERVTFFPSTVNFLLPLSCSNETEIIKANWMRNMKLQNLGLWLIFQDLWFQNYIMRWQNCSNSTSKVPSVSRNQECLCLKRSWKKWKMNVHQ